MVSSSGWALGKLFDLLAGDFISTSPRWHLQGTAALPSLRKGCSSIGPGANNPGWKNDSFVTSKAVDTFCE